jgi:cyclophilin family peptidyl-prolyl cis-trans isomerase/protein-disulfide isomerase
MRKVWFLVTAMALLVTIVGCDNIDTSVEPTSMVPTLASGDDPDPTPVPVETPIVAPTVEATGPGTCRVAPPIGDVAQGLPEITEEDHILGPVDAPVTLIEYADFQCPGCASFDPTLQYLVELQEGNLRLVYRHFPLSFHELALITGEGAEAAGAQGAFWEMHDLLYQNAAEWSGATEDEVIDIMVGYAEDIGIDVDQFRDEVESHIYRDKIESQGADAMAMGLRGTPSFIVNGRIYPFDWGLSGEALNFFIQTALLEPLQYDSPPPTVIDTESNYTATIVTNRGNIVIELYPASAPANVNSFVFLSQDGWYDSITFHRVVEGFVAQAGDPTGTGAGNPGYQCDDEIDPELIYDRPGMVGVANAGPNTGSSQFFITLDAVPQLDGGYTIIGQVIEGMDVVESLTPRDPQDPAAPAGDVIETILIEQG